LEINLNFGQKLLLRATHKGALFSATSVGYRSGITRYSRVWGKGSVPKNTVLIYLEYRRDDISIPAIVEKIWKFWKKFKKWKFIAA